MPTLPSHGPSAARNMVFGTCDLCWMQRFGAATRWKLEEEAQRHRVEPSIPVVPRLIAVLTAVRRTRLEVAEVVAQQRIHACSGEEQAGLLREGEPSLCK